MNELSGATALVTGASGFIGVAAARRFRDAGAIVHGVSRHRQMDGYCNRWWQADLGDISEVRRILGATRPDIVIHLASIVSGARELQMVLPSLHANLIAAVNLLVAATERGIKRLLLAGSLEEPQPDGTWPVATSPYAAAKFGAAVYARMCHALYGTPAIWLRLFMVYGPAQPDMLKLIPYVTLSLLRGEAPALSSGARLVDWVYIDDVMDALLCAAVTNDLEGRTLDIGSGNLVAVREVVEQLVKIIDPGISPSFGAVPERVLEQVRVADVDSTAVTLGWRARTPLEDGLRQTADWYRLHGLASRVRS